MDHWMLIEELRVLLHVPVDIISEGALRPHDRFRDERLKDAVPPCRPIHNSIPGERLR